MKGGAFLKLTASFDDAVMIFNDLFADGKSDPGSFINFLVMQPLENLEDLPVKMWFETYAIVGKLNVAEFFFMHRHFC
jgi:hypothetical protein